MKLGCGCGIRWRFCGSSKKEKTDDVVQPERSGPEDYLKGNEEGILKHAFNHQPNRADPEELTFPGDNEVAPSQSGSVEGIRDLAPNVVTTEAISEVVEESRFERQISGCLLSSGNIAFTSTSSVSRTLRVKSSSGDAVCRASEFRSAGFDRVPSACLNRPGSSAVLFSETGSTKLHVASSKSRPPLKRVRFKNTVEVIPN